jgi:methyl-accepting chemotaxis protein
MARSVQVFQDNAIKADAVAAEQEAERQKKERRQAAIDTLTGGSDLHATTVLETVATSLAEMRATAANMSVIATENTSKSSAVAAAAHDTSINVQRQQQPNSFRRLWSRSAAGHALGEHCRKGGRGRARPTPM